MSLLQGATVLTILSTVCAYIYTITTILEKLYV